MSSAVAIVAQKITAEQRDRFLEHIRSGATRWEAARMLDETATRFRGLAHVDPEFRALYVEACEERDRLAEETREDYRDALRSVLAERALNPEERSSRFLLAEAATHLPEYGWMRERGRRATHEAEGSLPKPLVDPSRYTLAQLEELETMWARLEELVAIGQGAPNPDLATEVAALVESTAA